MGLKELSEVLENRLQVAFARRPEKEIWAVYYTLIKSDKKFPAYVEERKRGHGPADAGEAAVFMGSYYAKRDFSKYASENWDIDRANRDFCKTHRLKYLVSDTKETTLTPEFIEAGEEEKWEEHVLDILSGMPKEEKARILVNSMEIKDVEGMNREYKGLLKLPNTELAARVIGLENRLGVEY